MKKRRGVVEDVSSLVISGTAARIGYSTEADRGNKQNDKRRTRKGNCRVNHGSCKRGGRSGERSCILSDTYEAVMVYVSGRKLQTTRYRLVLCVMMSRFSCTMMLVSILDPFCVSARADDKIMSMSRQN